MGLPACDVSRLQFVQNAAGRLFGGVFRYNSVEHILRNKLHWLPIVHRELNSGCLDTRLSMALLLPTCSGRTNVL